MKIKSNRILIYFLVFLIFILSEYLVNEDLSNSQTLEINCPEKLNYEINKFLFITSTDSEYIENIGITLVIDGKRADQLSFSRVDFVIDKTFKNIVFLKIDQSKYNLSSQFELNFTVRDKYGNIIKDSCVY